LASRGVRNPRSIEGGKGWDKVSPTLLLLILGLMGGWEFVPGGLDPPDLLRGVKGGQDPLTSAHPWAHGGLEEHPKCNEGGRTPLLLLILGLMGARRTP